MKDNDVYEFTWSEENRKNESYGGALNHCFEGLLVAKDGKLYDTYWGVKSDSRYDTYSGWKTKGTLKKLYNLNNMEEIPSHNIDYYNDSDIYMYHEQHWHRKTYLIKKGTKKSISKVRKILKYKIFEAEHDIEWNTRRIKEWKNKLEILKSNDFYFDEFYI